MDLLQFTAVYYIFMWIYYNKSIVKRSILLVYYELLWFYYNLLWFTMSTYILL